MFLQQSKKNNSMVEANLKIINELKLVLEEVSNNVELKSLFVDNPESFSRNRKLTLEKIVGIIINMPKRSLSIEINDFFNLLNDSKPATKGAFSLQRGKLLPVFFQVWNAWLVAYFYKHYGSDIKRWKGFILLAVDGSSVNLVEKKDVIDYFGTKTNQFGSTPMARIVQTYDVLNDITVMSVISPSTVSEKAIITSQLDRLYSDSITIFDRGFPGYEIMYLMQNQESSRHFVMRCKVDFNNEVRRFMRSKKTSIIIELTPTPLVVRELYKKGFIITKTTTIKVRMVKVKLSTGVTEVLLTNLYDEQEYTNEDLKFLYGLRWGIETSYGTQKNQLQLEQFSGHRVICIQQDFYASVFVSNLQSLISKQCDEYLKEININRKHNYKINLNVSWGALKNNIVHLFFIHEPKELLIKLQHLFERSTEPIRPNRIYKRDKKIKFS